jgi:exodeoxyribonuclease VIII
MIHPTFRGMQRKEIFHGMPFETYRELPAVNSHGLMDLRAHTPQHYLYKRDNPEEPTDAMQFGTLFHMLVLEPDRYDAEVHVGPCDHRGKKEWKDWAKDFPEDALLIRPMDDDALSDMRDSLLAHPKGKQLFTELEGKNESVILWQEKKTEIDCKARFDRIVSLDDTIIVVDLKTTVDVGYREFSKECAERQYDLQAAHYEDGAKAMFGMPVLYLIAAVEKEPPYHCRFFVADEPFMTHGYKRRDWALQRLVECIAAQHFPGYPQELENLGLPAWAFTEELDIL